MRTTRRRLLALLELALRSGELEKRLAISIAETLALESTPMTMSDAAGLYVDAVHEIPDTHLSEMLDADEKLYGEFANTMEACFDWLQAKRHLGGKISETALQMLDLSPDNSTIKAGQ
jgi:hypothetical protein